MRQERLVDQGVDEGRAASAGCAWASVAASLTGDTSQLMALGSERVGIEGLRGIVALEEGGYAPAATILHASPSISSPDVPILELPSLMSRTERMPRRTCNVRARNPRLQPAILRQYAAPAAVPQTTRRLTYDHDGQLHTLLGLLPSPADPGRHSRGG